MNDIPFLVGLGEEFGRVVCDEPRRRRRAKLRTLGAALAGISGIAALFFTVWALSLTSDVITPEQAVGQNESQTTETEVEILKASFESIVAELDWAQVGEIGTEIGRAGGPYPRVVLDALGSEFNVLHVPTSLPQGYSLFRELRAGDGFDRAPRIQTQVLNYDEWGFFIIDQFAQGFTPRAVNETAATRLQPLEIEGFQLYVRRADSEHVVYFFEKDGVWFDIIVANLKDAPGLGPGDVARTAMSLVAFDASVWGDGQAVLPSVSVFGGGSDEGDGRPSGDESGRCSGAGCTTPVTHPQDNLLTFLSVQGLEHRPLQRDDSWLIISERLHEAPA